MIKFIGFDKDGTLLDTTAVYIKAWGEIFHRDYGIDEEEASDYLKQTLGRQTADQVEELLLSHGTILPKKEVFDQAMKIVSEMGKIRVKAFPDVPPALEELKSKGYLIFVSSAFEENAVKNNLETAGIIRYIDLILGERQGQPDFRKGISHFKKAAEFFKITFENFKLSTVFVGDTQTDIRISNETDITCIGRIGTYSKEELLNCGASYAVEDFSGLSQLISEI